MTNATPIKLFDSELKVMEVLWRDGEKTAGDLARILKEQTGWNRNTTYTVIKKLLEKGAVKRREPGFLCRAVIPRSQVQRHEADELIDKWFDGSAEAFLSAYFSGKHLSPQEIEGLKRIVNELSQ